MGPGDATILQSWFRKQASRNGFYYDIQVDSDDAIYFIFWADSIMRADYALFGDFVSFDTTYRTNKSYRPLGVFVGFNHHKTTCIFGVLFYMMEVLRLTNEFLDQFKHLVKHVDDEDQFEYTWSLIQEKFFAYRRRSDISWLTFIYNSQKQWSSAWVKDNFTVGKRTTQLSEQFNAFARFYLKPEHSITQLLNRFHDLVDDLRHNELKFDFIMQNTVLENRHPNSRLMCHVAELFTLTMFEFIQKEFDACKA
ncbi:hypothetical protein LIER_32846 [Lithospermum erythrorhizon]|uniref:Protein FAR1-RELATED SEQUENCE n=1 Tax=Lithospermum erythrorhizon TaxID=34254 RepID=A0AAV3RWS0_LITER